MRLVQRKRDLIFEEINVWHNRPCEFQVFADRFCDDNTIDVFTFADRLFYPPHIARNLPQSTIRTVGAFQLEDKECAFIVYREDVYRSYSGRIFDTVATGLFSRPKIAPGLD